MAASRSPSSPTASWNATPPREDHLHHQALIRLGFSLFVTNVERLGFSAS